MLIILILLCVAGFTNGKAIPEELQKNAGGQKGAIPKGWETGGLLYNPRTDGRPIYVPPMIKSEHVMKDLLDDYYKPMPSLTLTTPPRRATDIKEVKEDEFEEPILRPSNTKKVPINNRRDKNSKVPNVKINLKQKNDENSKDENVEKKLIENYDEPIVSHSSKKTVNKNKSILVPKETKSVFQPNVNRDEFRTSGTVDKVSRKQKDKQTDSLLQTENVDDYDEPVIQHTSKKQATNLNKNGSKNTKVSTIKTEDFEEPAIQYTSKKKLTNLNKNESKISKISTTKTDYFEEPVVINSGKVSKPVSNVNMKQESKNLKTTKTESGTEDEYEEPLLRQSSKISLGDKNKNSPKIDSKNKQRTRWDEFDAPRTLKNVHKTDSGEFDKPVVRETSKSMNKKRKPNRVRLQRGKFTSERPTSRPFRRSDKA